MSKSAVAQLARRQMIEMIECGRQAALIEGPCAQCGARGRWDGFIYPASDVPRRAGAASWPLEAWWRELLPHEITFVSLCPACAEVEDGGIYQLSLEF